MHAVTRSGRKPKARISPHTWGLILASGMTSALAQESSAGQKSSAIDQLEQLMREQQDLQIRQTQQLQSMRQQLGEQTQHHTTQDWQAVGIMALALLVTFAGTRLKHWSATQRLLKFKKTNPQPTNALRELADDSANEQMHGTQPPVPSSSLEDSSSGHAIDHTGSGAIKQMLRNTQRKKAAKRPHSAAAKNTPDQMPADPSWLAALDDMDSQWLADEAVREFELRRVVGLHEAPEMPPASTRAAQQQHELDAEHAWQAMEEVFLSDLQAQAVSNAEKLRSADLTPEPVTPEPVTPEMSADVSVEVSRVRQGLRERRERREQREQQAKLQAAAQMPTALHEADCDIDIHSDADADTLGSTVEITPPKQEITPAATLPSEELTFAPQLMQGNFSISSLPAQTENETRLALGYEFQKLGQLDEAAQLYEEVLAASSGIDRMRARQLLSTLPGR
jgi:tetratricopeptide (TPR) repeat protein